MLLRRTAALALVVAALTACTATQATPAPAPSPTPTARPTPSPTPAGRTPTRRPITLAFGGDVHVEGAVRQRYLHDPLLASGETTIFDDVRPLLAGADLTVVNLETAVTDRGTAAEKQYVFRAPGGFFKDLKKGGVDVATLANNHGMDYGQVGLADTLEAARVNEFYGLIGAGRNEDEAYRPYRATVGGWRVAVLGASQVIAPELVKDWTAGPHHPGLASAYRVDRLTRAVREARRTSDTVVVYLHWGVERDSCPSDRQRTLARQLVAAGADIVVGSHAHVLQGSGRLGDAFVAYGLGNFLFYASGTGPSTQSEVLTLTVRGRRVLHATHSPVRLSDGRVHLVRGAAAEQARARITALRACANLS